LFFLVKGGIGQFGMSINRKVEAAGARPQVGIEVENWNFKKNPQNITGFKNVL